MVVNGETAVLLDESSDANFVRNKVYIGITHGLADVPFLNGFTNSVVSAEFISEGHASLVETSDLYHEMLEDSKASYRSGVTTTVAVAAASVTLVVASMFCYGFMRRPNSRDPSVRHRNRSIRKVNPRTIVAGRGVPMRRHFVRLEDLSASPTSFVTPSMSPRSYPNAYCPQNNDEEFPEDYSEEEYYTEVNYNPAINWSVSDITSDSASLRSGVSRTPSMLERIEEEIEDEEDDIREENDDDKSCNFSYSEDSTIITDALSKAGIVSPEDEEGEEEDKRDDENHTGNDYSSKDQILDLSDLDPCFTILPENPEELFRDLEDLSEGTQDSPLESIILELRLSTEGSDCDSFKTALSDATMISLPPLWEKSVREGHKSQFENESEASESSSMKSLISKEKENVDSNDEANTSSPLQEDDMSASFCSAIDESPICTADRKEELRNNDTSPMTPISTTIISEESEVDPLSRDEIIPTVSDSDDDCSEEAPVDDEISVAEIESENDDGASIGSIAPTSHFHDCNHKLPPTSSWDSGSSLYTDIGVTNDSYSIDKVASKGEEKAGTFHPSDGMDYEDDDQDSINEWVSELLNQGPRGKSECTVDDT